MRFLMHLLALVPSFVVPAPASEKATLTVTVQNVQSKKGTIRIALMKPCAKFPECKPDDTAIIEAKNGLIQKEFDVEPGEYAVAVYHDVNANGALDKRMFGIPKEPYGFSNNFRPTLSAPKFTDCKIVVGSGGKAISIRIE
ncbi:DUF2141 domain-containing protein [Rudanella lutea]|uniref:DUF2141 domain-containing protein n=1 Tax=Rudanella lutea TaxID=451374 RepID=UPI000361A841|nr:DUF2141 domain-containing protein [Rudanella lutea]